jgi:hypothetical protein
MFDGVFDRNELFNLLALLQLGNSIRANLRDNYWPHCEFDLRIYHLEVTVRIRTLFARGGWNHALTPELLDHMLEQQMTITEPRIWLHAETSVGGVPDFILRASTDT